MFCIRGPDLKSKDEYNNCTDRGIFFSVRKDIEKNTIFYNISFIF